MRIKRNVRFAVTFAALLGLSIIPLGVSQRVASQQSDDDEQSRQMFATEFVNSRPGPKPPRTTPTKATTTTPAKATNTTSNLAAEMLGVTLWRLRPAAAKDDVQTRLLDHESDSEAFLVAERVSSDTQFTEGQKVRLSIESPRTGYLYVIDREEYADGTFSEPYLIFPTLKTRNGDNAVTAGRLIEIPDQEDKPIYFKMKRSRPDQVREVLTVLVTAQPIPNMELTPKPMKLPYEQFARWEQSWKAPAKRVEVAHHPVATYTKAEMIAGSKVSSLLGRNDPPPQTIFRVSGKPKDPILISISLQYAAAQ
jgi:hypothetical protein